MRLLVGSCRKFVRSMKFDFLFFSSVPTIHLAGLAASGKARLEKTTTSKTSGGRTSTTRTYSLFFSQSSIAHQDGSGLV